VILSELLVICIVNTLFFSSSSSAASEKPAGDSKPNQWEESDHEGTD